MSNCSCCGSSVPEGQVVCSMCYGDIDYGSDGYYKEWAEKQWFGEEDRFEREKEWYNNYKENNSDDLPF